VGVIMAAAHLPTHQPSLATILTPKWRSALARLRQRGSGTSTRILLLALVGLGFWSAIFGIAFRVLRYFRGVADIGNLVAAKILGILLLAFLAILLLSNLITALSTFFLAKDLDLMVGAPVDWFRFYLSKLGETLVHSSWMVILVAIPIFTAYGFVFDGGLLFPFVAMAATVPYLVVPAVLGSALTLLLVNLFPARRTRDLLSLIAIGAAGGVVLLLRFIRPEQIARPEGFRNLLDFITLLRAPTNPFFPSEWAAQMVMNWLLRLADPLPILLLWTTAGAAVVFGALVHRTYYLPGFSKAQEGADRFVRGRAWQGLADRLLGTLPASKREFILKDLRLFFRDSTQWSQLILLAVLLVVYLFNIQALQLFSGERVPFFLVTLVVFLNQGLAGFVLAAIAARFIFPSISLEGRQMWLLRSSPLDLRALLWSKYWIGTVPLLVLALILTVTTNALLQASGFMMALSIVTITLFTLAVSALALGFGALYPQFETENAAQIPTSFGGLVFMMTTISLLGLVIVVEAIPVTGYLRARQAGMAPGLTPELVLTMVVVVTVCSIATLVPLKIGLKRMSEMEF
jgi:ABC-2 type transport system permease protein